MTRLDPTNPEAAFRFHLLMSLAPHAGASDPVDLAARAFDFIYGPRQAVPQEPSHDQHTETPPQPADAGGDAQGGRGGQPDKGRDLQPEPNGGGDVGGADGEPGDPAPAQGAEPETGEGLTAPPEASTKRNGYRPWAPEEELHLERLVASGMSYADIATTLDRPIHGVYSRVSDSGINKRWPRTSRGALQHEPYPLDAPWPPSAEQMVPVTPPTRKAELLALMNEGLSAREIADKLNISPSGVSARATQWRITAQWRAARERRKAQQGTAEVPAPELEPPVVEMPPPATAPQPSADDLAAVALVADKHPLAARDVQPGQSWAFNRRTLAEVAEPSRPEVAPLPSKEERDRLIAEHIAVKGVTTGEPDFGPDQPAVDVLRSVFHSVVRSNRSAAPWLINGAPVTTLILWKRANAELKQQGKKPIKRKD